MEKSKACLLPLIIGCLRIEMICPEVPILPALIKTDINFSCIIDFSEIVVNHKIPSPEIT